MKEFINFLKSLRFDEFAFEIFLSLLILNWFFYFIDYLKLITAVFISIIILLSWIIYFIRLKEEKNEN